MLFIIIVTRATLAVAVACALNRARQWSQCVNVTKCVIYIYVRTYMLGHFICSVTLLLTLGAHVQRGL